VKNSQRTFPLASKLQKMHRLIITAKYRDLRENPKGKITGEILF